MKTATIARRIRNVRGDDDAGDDDAGDHVAGDGSPTSGEAPKCSMRSAQSWESEDCSPMVIA